MLSKLNRLKKKKDFEATFKKGKFLKSKNFILRFAKNNLEFSRFGFIVSQKVSKKAVVRNKVRRRVSAIIKNSFESIKPGQDIIFIALFGADKKNFSEVKEEVLEILNTSKLIKNV
jgi:ribonuclease P protein component